MKGRVQSRKGVFAILLRSHGFDESRREQRSTGYVRSRQYKRRPKPRHHGGKRRSEGGNGEDGGTGRSCAEEMGCCDRSGRGGVKRGEEQPRQRAADILRLQSAKLLKG